MPQNNGILTTTNSNLVPEVIGGQKPAGGKHSTVAGTKTHK